MKDKKELTYILGAGASFQSFPVVDKFVQRFDEFAKQYISDCADAAKDGIEYISELEKGKDIIIELGKEFESHQSFDTYFKKLFHQGKEKKIKEGKKILNLYFLWEHLYKNISKPGYDSAAFYKQSKIDRRYDALIAGLLQPINSVNPYCKVNFVSWNYDLNLISSIKNFFSPTLNWGDFLKQIKQNNGVWNIDEKIFVYNINGFFYSEFLASGNLEFYEDFYSILKRKIRFQYFSSDTPDNDSEYIKFAWENENDQLIPLAAHAAKNSKNIVVIGYSFPLYNRSIDLSILDRKFLNSSDTPIYIQDIQAQNRVESFIDNFNLPHKAKEIIPIKNCDFFYIPSNIFGEIDDKGNYHII